MTQAITRPLEWTPRKPAISRVPYLPGLDGLRALAVAAVMVYHASTDWLPGGFLGVEVFFVISGYLITLLLIGEHERTGRVNLGQFWLRRAKRLLPALFTLLIGITIYSALFRQDALGQLRGDVVAGLTYVSNWYQIWVGQGYTASGDFAPLRHLWSLAVEEQYYLLWPLVMVGLMRLGRRRLPELSRWLFLAAVVVAVVLALAYHAGPIDGPETTPGAFWSVGDRALSKADALYLGTFSRAGGLLLGSAFAMIWRPFALRRGPIRRFGRWFDLGALVGLAALGALCWFVHYLTPDGADPWLFRGGFLITGVASLLVIAAITHPGAVTGKLLGNPVLLWAGTRSYGLYLYHWPVYQIIREVAGRPLTVAEFVLAMVITLPITEFSYRMIETPIRSGRIKRWWRRLSAQPDPTPRRIIAGFLAGVLALAMFSTATMATAELEPNEIAQSLDAGEDVIVDLEDLLPGATTTTVEGSPATATTGVPVPDGGPEDVVVPLEPTTTLAPTTTAAPTTTVPATTTTLFPPGATFALGDSVMQGAATALNERGIFVDADKNRQMNTMIPLVEGLRDAGTLATFGAVVVHLGTNGPISEDTMTRFFTALAGVPEVLVLTVRADRSWTADVNARIFALPNQFPNVKLLDWGGLSNACPGACFYSDNIHLQPAGAQYYAQLVQDFLAA